MSQALDQGGSVLGPSRCKESKESRNAGKSEPVTCPNSDVRRCSSLRLQLP
jgi:hypothetical protein